MGFIADIDQTHFTWPDAVAFIALGVVVVMVIWIRSRCPRPPRR